MTNQFKLYIEKACWTAVAIFQSQCGLVIMYCDSSVFDIRTILGYWLFVYPCTVVYTY
jgi:hypothetical protein